MSVQVDSWSANDAAHRLDRAIFEELGDDVEIEANDKSMKLVLTNDEADRLTAALRHVAES